MITPVQEQDISTQTQISTVLIDGATGYIGSHLAYALKQLPQLTVRCLAREGTDQANIEFLQTSGAKVWQANLGDKTEAVAEAFSQADVACHLIGSIAPKRGETPESTHIEQTERFVEHCCQAKVNKVIMVSACGADSQSDIAYHHTKWQAEQIIKESGIPAIILRPSLIIGKTTGLRNSKLITRLQDLIADKKAVPLVAGGHNKVQPLFINDLVEAIITAIFKIKGDSGTNMPILELGGPEVLTLRELTVLLMQVMGKERSILDLPAPVAMAVAYSSEALQGVPILSRDQVKLSQKDNICSNNQLTALIHKSPTSVKEALASYKL